MGTKLTKVLLVYPNAEGYSRIPVGFSIISAYLKDRGHDVALFDTTFIKSKNIDYEYREKANLVKSVDINHLYNIQREAQIEAELANLLGKYAPDLIFFTIVEENYSYATQLMKTVKETADGLIVAGGVTPTVVPEEIIKI